MVRKCVVCGQQYVSGFETSFHTFPKQEVRRNLWLKACQIETVPKLAFVCSNHFAADSYLPHREHGLNILKPTAVPFHFTISKDVNDESGERIISSMQADDQGPEMRNQEITEEELFQRTDENSPNNGNFDTPKSEIVKEPMKRKLDSPTNKNSADSEQQYGTPLKNKKIWRPARVGDLTATDFSTPRRAEKHCTLVKTTISEQRRKIKNLQLQNKRLHHKVETLTDLITELRKKNLISKCAAETLLTTGSDTLSEIMSRKLAGKKAKFTREMRPFAVTLQFYASKAYNYVRKVFKNVLPHPRTITKWYQVVDGRPGFTKEVFDAIREKSKAETVLCNLVIDEMAIREHIEWDGKQYRGFVDMGMEYKCDSDDLPMAKNALVFLVTSLNSSWKVPLGYFLIKGLNGAERANLLRMCLLLLHETGAHLYSITFDGAHVNKAMCHKLGADFDINSSKNYILHPISSKKVYVFLDPSHAIKLIRNTIADKKVLINAKGESIKWDYIVKLFEKEKQEGLRVATKLTSRHVHFENEKMNVRLAAQTLSESVSKALTFCKLIGDTNFNDSAATSEFCLIMNNAFDILNARSKFSKAPFNSPVSIETIAKYKEFTLNATEYISTVALPTGHKLIHGARSTGFIGIIIDLQNLLELYTFLTEERYLQYLLSFKLSQDHLETFFSAIRSRGGFNSNPTSKQFEAAYKKLFVHHQITGSQYGNCSILDTSSILPIAQYSNRIVDEPHPEVIQPIDHDYIESILSLNSFVENIVEYIAGFVVRKIKRIIHCTICMQYLELDKSDNMLITLKNRGNLIKPSKDVQLICVWAEKNIRQNEHRIFKANTRYIITNGIRRNVKHCVFLNMKNHVIAQDPLDNHRTQLIDHIIACYVDLRFHHIGRCQKKKTVLV